MSGALSCVRCGCTEDNACQVVGVGGQVVGCSWVRVTPGDAFCSACAFPSSRVRGPETVTELRERVARVERHLSEVELSRSGWTLRAERTGRALEALRSAVLATGHTAGNPSNVGAPTASSWCCCVGAPHTRPCRGLRAALAGAAAALNPSERDLADQAKRLLELAKGGR